MGNKKRYKTYFINIKNSELFDLQGKPCKATMHTVDSFLAVPKKLDKQASWKDMNSYPLWCSTKDKSTWHPTIVNAG